MKKRILSIVLSIVMLVSLLPTTALASDTRVMVGGVEMYSADGATYYVNGATTAVTTEPNNWNAKYENGTLTIKNLSVTGTAASDYAGIFSTVDLKIVLEGGNSVTGGDDNEWHAYGINVYGDLTISGDGALSVTGGNPSVSTYGGSYGIYAGGAITISGGTISANGGTASSGSTYGDSCGIYAYEAITISGGTISANGGTASSGSSYGISGYDGANVTTTGGILVARGNGTTAKAINGTLNMKEAETVKTKLAGQVVGGEFTGSPAEFNENATALTIVPESYTVKNTPLTGTNQTEYTIDTNTAVVTPGTSGNGTPLVITENDSTVTLNGDLVLINLLGKFVTPAFSFSGSSASPAKVTGSGTLTAIGAAKSDGNSYGISASGNSYLTVDGVDVIAIGTASNKSYGIGAAANVTVSNGGSVVAIGGTASNKSYGIGSYNLSVSDTGKITAIGGAVGDSAFSYGIDTYKASISDTAEVTAVGGTGGSMSASYGVGCSNAVSTDSITVAGGTLNAVAGKTGGNSYGINNAAGTVEIGKNSTGGTVTAVGGAAASFSSGVRGGTVTVKSGTLNAVGGITNHTSYGIELKIALKVSGGTVDAAGVDYGIDGQYGQGVTISGGTVTAVGGRFGLIVSSGSSLAGGSYTGGENAVYCQNGVNALLASGYSYYSGDTLLTPADSDKTVGLAYQTVTIGLASATLTPPTANDLTYNGGDQSLVSAGTAIGGELEYALGTDDTTAPVTGWSATLPQGKNAGTYYVWYKVVGDDNHNDIAPACVAVTIAKKQIAKPAADNSTFTYNGNDQTYALNGDPAFVINNYVQKNAGSYTVTVTLQDTANYEWTDGTTAALEYTFTIEQQALTIVWGNSSFTYDGTEKFPAFNVDGIWNADDVEVTHSSAQVNASDTAYTATITGLTGSDAANYKLTGTLTKEFTIAKADQIAPTGLTTADTTYFGKADGKIFGLTSAMEFRKEGDSAYTAGFNGTLEYLEAGTYYVRYQGDVNHNPSLDTAFSVSEGRKLNIIVPQNPIGYTVTVNKTEMEYEGSYTLKVEINEGYTATEDFKIIISSWACGQQAGVEETYMNAIADQIIEVQGVADITAPAAKIEVAENGWTTFLNTITFGQFFKENQNVTISATDLGSGVNSIEYYIANGEMTLDAVKAITAWEGYNGTFRINPDNQYVIYAKVTDNAGNITYISSDGLVLDATAPALFGIENNGVYYGDKIFKAIDDHFLKIEIDGIDVTDTTQGDDEYKVTADNAEHIVTTTDKAGNATEYKITVFKNYTVIYKVDGNTVSTQTVGHGKDATAPTIPEKEGYTQTAPYWNKDGKNITADTEINAVYTINKYTVTFNSNGGNKVDGIPDVIHGTVITEPTAPTKENATFAGWFSDSDCTKAWNFAKDTVTADLTLYAKWSDVPVFHISGKVLEKTGDGENDTGGVPNANVKLMLGTTAVAEQITEADGTFYFGGQIAGDYNVVVTYRAPNSEHDKVVTALVEVHGNDADGIIVTLPRDVTNSIVEHEPAADGKDSVAAGTLVGGLENVAAAVRSENQNAQKVEVKLTVADQPPVTGTPTAGTEAAKQQAQQKAIQQKAGGKQLVFFDLSVVKTINGGTPVAITDTGDTLLEIRIPFDSGNKWGITIYRYHGDKAEVLAAVREGSTTEGFWVGDDGYIHIYTKKFSTYAVGYTVPSYGYFVPVTPDTVTSADTFDAGIVVYVTMSMLAATGSAVVIGKKRKEN